MACRIVAAPLLLTVVLGCATVSEGDGRLDDVDASANDLGKPDDALDAGGADVRDVTAEPMDVPGDEVAVADVNADRGVDSPDVVDLGAGVECEMGSTRACYTGNPGTRMVGLCFDGFQRCASGRWATTCNGEILPAVETCNGIDDDCDTAVDNIATAPCYTGAPGTQGVGICRAGTYRCVGSTRGCSDQVVPQLMEACGNRLDDNCNGMTDEGCP